MVDMAARPYICESCGGRMMMTDSKYRELSSLGRLVYCLHCRRAGFPAKIISGLSIRRAA